MFEPPLRQLGGNIEFHPLIAAIRSRLNIENRR
jgi:hypothetical protein